MKRDNDGLTLEERGETKDADGVDHGVKERDTVNGMVQSSKSSRILSL
jgi:hypothetical protein